MTTDTIRRAADLIRSRAAAAAPGPWTSHLHGVTTTGYGHLHTGAPRSLAGTRHLPDAEHIAGMDPLVALALAAFLDNCAAQLAVGSCDEPGAVEYAVDIARTYLGETP